MIATALITAKFYPNSITDDFDSKVEELNKTSYNKLRIVIGFVQGKNFKKILNLFPKDAFFYFCQPKINRALNVEEVFNYSNEIGLNSKSFLSVKTAYGICLNESSKDDLIFICGSSFVVSEIISN